MMSKTILMSCHISHSFYLSHTEMLNCNLLIDLLLKSVLLYKILNENYSPCLRDMFVRLRDLNRQYNLRNYDMDLALPKPKTNFLKRSFKYNASLLWNNLPLEAKTATSLHQFKRSIANCRFLEYC